MSVLAGYPGGTVYCSIFRHHLSKKPRCQKKGRSSGDSPSCALPRHRHSLNRTKWIVAAFKAKMTCENISHKTHIIDAPMRAKAA